MAITSAARCGRISNLRHTKIIVVTGRDYAADRKSAEEAGADDLSSSSRSIFGELLSALRTRAACAAQRPQHGARSRKPSPPGGARGRDAGEVSGACAARSRRRGRQTVFFGGNTSCVEVRADGRAHHARRGLGHPPAGPGARTRSSRRQPIDLTLLISHTHWDHIQGFPFFLPAYTPRTGCASSATKARATASRRRSPGRWRARISRSRSSRCRETSSSRS